MTTATAPDRESTSIPRMLSNMLGIDAGRWALLKEDRLLGTYASEDEATAAGHEIVGPNSSFATRELGGDEQVNGFNRDCLIGALGID